MSLSLIRCPYHSSGNLATQNLFLTLCLISPCVAARETVTSDGWLTLRPAVTPWSQPVGRVYMYFPQGTYSVGRPHGQVHCSTTNMADSCKALGLILGPVPVSPGPTTARPTCQSALTQHCVHVAMDIIHVPHPLLGVMLAGDVPCAKV